MSKLSFRARQVDYTKPLPIYLNHDLPDLQDFAAINRAVPQMPTGMEKDEEAEHHLQRALSALQAFGDKSSNDYSIPTPKVEIDNKMYERIYNIECPKQKQYIRIQPFSNDYDYPDYDADYEDESWLTEMRKTLPADFTEDLVLYFETVMDKLEKATCYSTNLMSLEEARLILIKDKNNNASDDTESLGSSATREKYQKELEAFLIAIYEYWKKKRTKWKHPLTPIVMTDKSGIVTAPNNPYLVFRRRIEKMQTRKNRKNEEQSYEKMLILKRDLCRAQHILKLIKKRETFKKEFLKLTLETFEKRYKLNDYDGAIADQITCMLRPVPSLPQDTAHPTTTTANNTNKLSQNNNHNNNNSSSLSSIDKTIVNLINANKLKTLASSPPHTKRPPNLDGELKQQRHKKTEKRVREDSAPSGNISSLISNKANQKIIGNLIDLSNKSKMHAHLLNSSLKKQSQVLQPGSPLLSTSKLEMFKKTHKLISSMELEQMQFNRMVSSQRCRNNSVNSRQQLSEKAAETGGERPSEEGVGGGQRSAGLLGVFNELRAYEEELRANQIENLDAVLSEAKSRLSTSSDKDGYWYFKRKEGCKYLPQSGPIFKNDALAEATFATKQPQTSEASTMEPPAHVQALLSLSQKSKPAARTKPKRKDRLRDLQQFYYGYVVTGRQRHLGLVRRRVGRGGRVVLEKFNEELADSVADFDLTTTNRNASDEQVFNFDFNKFKTYYPVECFDLNETATNKPPEFQVPDTSSSTNQPKKKKLKLKSFHPTTTTTTTDTASDDYDDQPDTFYDHTLFDPLQINTHVNTTNRQFIDAHTEAQLTAAATDDLHIQQLVHEQITKAATQQQQQQHQASRVPQSTITDLTAFTNPITNYEYLGTDLDFDNLFEPDQSAADAVVVSQTGNVIRVNADVSPLNYEYRPGSGHECLGLASVREALKSLKVVGNKQKPVDIENGVGNKRQKVGEGRGRSDVGLIPSPAGSCDECGLNRGEEEGEDKASSESLANITSTTLTPPSPSPEGKKADDDTSTSVASEKTVGLSKLAVLSGTSSSRLQALNKASNQFQFRPLSPSPNTNCNNKSNEAVNTNTILIPNGTSYLVKNKNSPQVNHSSINSNNNQTTSFYSSCTSSSSSPSSSSLSTATINSVTISSGSSGNNGSIGAGAGVGGVGGGSIPISSVSQHSQPPSQHSSVIVNGLLSKKKDENSPFYPVYQNNNSTNESQQQQQQNTSKLLQAIHFNQSNSHNLVASIQATSSSAPSSSSSSHSSGYSNNSVHSHLYHHHHGHHQKQVNGQGQSSGNLSVVVQQVPTPVGDHATKTTKLI